MSDEKTETKTADQEEAVKPSSSSKFTIWLLLAVLVVAAIGYVATTKTGVDKALVEDQLQNWIAYTKEQNPDIEITYESIEMAGDVSDRHAIVNHLRVSNEQDEIEATTHLPQVLIHPKSVAFDEFRVTLPSLEMSADNGEQLVVRFEPPLLTDVTLIEEDGEVVIDTVTPMAGAWVFDPEGQLPYKLTFGEGSRLVSRYDADWTKRGNMEMDITSMDVTNEMDPEQHLTADAITLKTQWNQGEETQGAVSLSFDMQKLFSDEETMPYGAINLSVDGDYSGPLESLDTVDWASEKAHFDLRNFTLSVDEAALKTALSFQTGRGEILPIGEGQLTLENFAFVLEELRKNEVLGEAEEKLTSVLLKQITGQELDAITNLDIPVKRVDGGSLQVGQSNFEELFAIFLTGGNVQPGTTQPAAPAEEEIDEEEVKELFDAE